MLFGKHFFPYMGGRPFFIKHFRIQIIIIIACCGNDIQIPVRDTNQVIALFDHLFRIGIPVIPSAHQHVFRFYRCFTLCVRQSSPDTSLLAETFHKTDIVIGESTEFLHHILLFIGIFVRSNMDTFAGKDGITSFQVLAEKSIHELISFRFEQVKMIHAILFAADLRLILCKSKRMCRDIYLRNDLHTQAIGELLQGDKLLFCIIAIAGGQSGKSFTFEAESRIGLVPVVIVILLESIIVQVDLECVHLIVGHHLHIIT